MAKPRAYPGVLAGSDNQDTVRDAWLSLPAQCVRVDMLLAVGAAYLSKVLPNLLLDFRFRLPLLADDL